MNMMNIMKKVVCMTSAIHTTVAKYSVYGKIYFTRSSVPDR